MLGKTGLRGMGSVPRKWDVQREIRTFLLSEVAEEPMTHGCCQGCEETMRCGDFFHYIILV